AQWRSGAEIGPSPARTRGASAAAVYSLIATCKLNDVDPRAWLADVLARLPDHPAHRVGEMMPWAGRSAKRPRPASRPPSPHSQPQPVAATASPHPGRISEAY